MDDKRCIVTGASRGIGFFTARALAMMGAHVTLIGHHRGRGEAALERIRGDLDAEPAAERGSVAFSLVDLSVQHAIRRFADEYKAEYESLHVLVNNAGGFFFNRRESADGIEMTLALNHLNYFLMTARLLDVVRETGAHSEEGAARIVNVASESHRDSRIHFDDLQFEEAYKPREAYGQSKLANLLFTYELARRLEDDQVTANACHPGFVNTRLGKDHWLVGPVLDVIHFFLAKSPEEGAEVPIYLASSPDVEGVSGEYFVGQGDGSTLSPGSTQSPGSTLSASSTPSPTRSSPASYDEEKARRLWEVSEALTAG
jgi:NAD(P)-dependent dehydrogenase (short-subunit alcohol dehydrogenase family)